MPSRSRQLSCLLLVLIAGCGRPKVEPSKTARSGEAPESESSLLVDDFEDGDGASLQGGYWYVYVDEDNGGLSSLDIPRKGGSLLMDGEGFDGSRHSLEVSYRFDQGKLPYPPYVGIGVQLKGAQTDLRDYGALRYSYRGAAHSVRIETAEVRDYDFYAMQLPASPSWRTVTLEFSLFRQAGWGKKAPFSLDQVRALGWQLRGETGDAGDFQLDDVSLIAADLQTPKVPDLQIRDPAPPEPVPLASPRVTHPLQALSMKALDRGYNITNWLEQGRYEEGGKYDEAFVSRLAAAGFLGVRLPIDLDLYVQEQSEGGGETSFDLHPSLFSVLDDFDRWTTAHGLSLTIDYHQYDRSLDIENEDSKREVIALWGKVAAHFAQNPRQDLFYELLNEPELAAKRGPTAREWSELSSELIAEIRRHDQERPILFGDVKWYGIDELAGRTPFDDPNIIYVFHFYEPFIFTHQGAPWAGLGTTHDIPYPYSKERWSPYQRDFGFTEFNEPWQLDQLRSYYKNGNRTALRNRLVKVKAWATQHNVPVICNEFGVYEAAAQEADIAQYYTDLIELFGELEIPWQIWFMVMDAQTGEVDPALRRALRLDDTN